MTPTTRKMLIGVGGVAGLAILWQLANWTYLTDRRKLDAEIATLSKTIETCRHAMDRDVEAEASVRALVDRTLGGRPEAVDHRLRSRLNRIVEAVGIDSAVVGTGTASPRVSPARSALRKMRLPPSLADSDDFIELEGWVSGEGTLAQVVEFADRVDAEPWIKRIDQLRIDGRSDGDRFSFTLRLTTLFLPDREPALEPAVSIYDRSRLSAFLPFVTANPFKVALPVVAEAAPNPEPAMPLEEPRFPWSQWSLTGVAEGPLGTEAWLWNRSSGETCQLHIGEQLNEAVLLAAAGEWAEFRVLEERFRVRIGGNMSDRSPMTE